MKYFGTITDPKDLVNKEYIDDIADTKANTDGAYESMTVGNAEQLVSTVMVNDKAPYLFRTSGGSADIGNREYDTLVGGTVAWNQLTLENDATINTVSKTFSNGKIVLNGTTSQVGSLNYATNLNLPGHKILYKTDNAQHDGLRFVIRDDTNSTNIFFPAYGDNFGDGIINVPSTCTFLSLYSIIDTNTTFNNFAYSVQIFDLTQMFGTTIADYIYGLEQANVGAGVAWFKALFSDDYYPYNAGTLLSVSGVSAHQMTGFNQWDEVWELGAYNSTTGEASASTNRIRGKNLIPVIPNTTYYCYIDGNSAVNALFYDNNSTLITGYYTGSSHVNNASNIANTTFVTPGNCAYVKIYMAQDYGNTYNHDICINISWSGYRNGEYEPYVLHSYPLDSDLTLRGVPLLDADNKLYYDGDTYEADGTVTRRYGVVDLGTLDWDYISGGNAFFVDGTIIGAKKPASNVFPNLVSPPYIPQQTKNTISAYATYPDKSITYYVPSDGFSVVIKDSTYGTDAAAFKTAMSGVYLVYELATPITENADAFQSPQIVDDFGTERYVVTAQSGVEVPVGHSTDYGKNLRDLLQHLPDLSDDGNGTYVIQQTGTQMALTPLVFPEELPTAPTTDGSYTLQITVADGTTTYSWVSTS